MDIGFSKSDIPNLTKRQIDLYYSYYLKNRDHEYGRTIQGIAIAMGDGKNLKSILDKLSNA